MAITDSLDSATTEVLALVTAINAERAALLSHYLALTGGTMTGALTLAGDPTAALQAATKEYVDAQKALVIASTVQTISATTFYVNSFTGSDSNNGLTPTTAFATIQACVNYVSQFYCAGTVTVNIAAGTYTSSAQSVVFVSQSLIAAWNFVGAGVSTIIDGSGTGKIAFNINVGVTATLTGVLCKAYYYCISSWGELFLGTVTCQLTNAATSTGLYTNENGIIFNVGGATWTFTGTGNSCGSSTNGGSISAGYHDAYSSRSLTIVYTSCVANYNFTAIMHATFSLDPTMITWSGAPTGGIRYSVTLNSYVQVWGAGSTLIPGAGAGTVDATSTYA